MPHQPCGEGGRWAWQPQVLWNILREFFGVDMCLGFWERPSALSSAVKRVWSVHSIQQRRQNNQSCLAFCAACQRDQKTARPPEGATNCGEKNKRPRLGIHWLTTTWIVWSGWSWRGRRRACAVGFVVSASLCPLSCGCWYVFFVFFPLPHCILKMLKLFFWVL